METFERARDPRWKAHLARAAKHLFLDRKLEHWLGEWDATRSLTALRARVVDIIDETPDVKTFVLRTNAHWRGHRAGQYTTLEVELDGRRVRRCYSLSSASSAPGVATVTVTVKRVPDGQVSPWLHANLRVGSIVGLSPAAGDFVLPAQGAPKLCFLTGGSGITPAMAILRDLAGWNDARGLADVVFIHHARSAADVPFRAALEAFAARHPGLRLVIRTDDAPGGDGTFSEARLAALVPDLAERLTFLCGPAGLMARVERHFADANLGARLVSERFVVPGAIAPPAPDAPADQIVKLRLAVSGRSFAASSTGTLLEQLERNGERPAHGCRIGICHTCKCRKVAGTVQNLHTGELSSTPEEDIQLCISIPRSDVELSL